MPQHWCSVLTHSPAAQSPRETGPALIANGYTTALGACRIGDWQHVARGIRTSEVPNATQRARAGTLVQSRRQLAPPALLPSVELGADENIDIGLQRAHQTERATDKALRL